MSSRVCECGQHHAMGWAPEQNKKQRMSFVLAIVSGSSLSMQCDPLPHTPTTMTSPTVMDCTPKTMSQIKSPFRKLL